MSTLVIRSVIFGNRRTSMRLEPEMWEALEEVCRREDMTIGEFFSAVDRQRGDAGLTAATRVLLLLYFRAAATGEGRALLPWMNLNSAVALGAAAPNPARGDAPNPL
ncbi:MAG: ribbon-helix-helix domain-containing protein [Alphaproteobacteria bacterium]